MTPHDPIFITLQGDPVTGRKPASARVLGDAPLTEEQQEGVEHAFLRFVDQLRVSVNPDDGTDQQRLPDGTVVYLNAIAGQVYMDVIPPGRPNPGGLADWFHGVPANATIVSGTSTLGPSASWRVPAYPSEMPDELTPQRELDLHPGHVTWSNPDLKYGGFPIVVSWRGPRDRYASSIGWSDAAGTTMVPHNETGEDIGEESFTDSQYVWINGRRIDTGIGKIIAACLHEYDPVGAPNSFVLRVCTDMYPNPGTTRGVAVYDLVAESGADGSTLKQLSEATAELFVKDTYAAADYRNNLTVASGTGKWDMVQRPHFNRSGDQLATIISRVGADYANGAAGVGILAVSFNATTWAIEESVPAPTSSTTVSSTTPTSATGMTYTTTTETEATYMVAADFNGDTFVYVALELATSVEQTGEWEQGVYGAVYRPMEHNYTRTSITDWTLSHSEVGMLKTHSATQTLDYAYIVEEIAANYVYTASVSNTGSKHQRVALVGDLSRGAFAVGYDGGNSSTETGSLSMSSPTLDTPPAITTTLTMYGERFTFDVWLDGQLVEEDTTGAYSNAAASTVVTASTETAQVGGGTPTFPNSSSTYAAGPSQYITSTWTPAADYAHAAVRSTADAFYVGAAYIDVLTSTPGSGIEIAAFKAGDAYVTDDPPAYAGGTRPTVSAPVFTGPATTGEPA
jgi:hypothetical protein